MSLWLWSNSSVFVSDSIIKLIGRRMNYWISIQSLWCTLSAKDHSPLRCGALSACKKKQQHVIWASILPRASGDISLLNPEQQQVNQSLFSIYKAERKPRCSEKILMASGQAERGWWNSQKHCCKMLLRPLLFCPCHCHVPVMHFCWYMFLCLWF